MIALVDCNNFFASCERLFRPDLKDKPVLVLSSNDGCVVARSNEVKELGIPMGVPYFKVRDVVDRNSIQCFSSNFELYSDMSQRIIKVLSEYVQKIEVYSIDEAFLDLNDLAVKDYQAWGEGLRIAIATQLGMPVSVGIAPSKTLAKLASSYAKKHQQTCLLDPANDPKVYQHVLEETAVEDIWGIGWRRAPQLKRAGIHTAWQLANTSSKWLHAQAGINGSRLHQELNGLSAYPFEDVAKPQKSIMASRSFGVSVKTLHQLEIAVASFASQAAYKLRKHEQTTQLFGVYLRYRTPDNTQKSHSAVARLLTASNYTTDLVSAALKLTRQLYDPSMRYIKAGVFAYHLGPSDKTQLNMFDSKNHDAREKSATLMQALDQINKRFGANTLHVGVIDPNVNQWHAKKEKMSPAYTTQWSQLPEVHAYKAGG